MNQLVLVPNKINVHSEFAQETQTASNQHINENEEIKMKPIIYSAERKGKLWVTTDRQEKALSFYSVREKKNHVLIKPEPKAPRWEEYKEEKVEILNNNLSSEKRELV